MSSLTRRQFIQIGGVAAGAAVIGSGATTRWWGLDKSGTTDPGTDGDQVVASFCEMCFWNCGVLAHVKDGKVTKIVGNPDHPLSKGRLCPRGVGAIGQLYDPDRLKKPLIRVRDAKRGEDRFEEVDWKTALDFTAQRLDAVRQQYGPEAVALFTHGFGGAWFKQLMKAFGSPNVAAPSFAQCRGPREAAFNVTYGTGLGSPEPLDIANARCITLIGSHLGENMHNSQVQELSDAIDRGAELVVVDPRYSVAASKAKHWLPIKPGTDIALLLAWMNVIIGEHRYDAEYVAKYAVGFDELKAHVADKTPEWAYAITGLRPELIRDSARTIAGARPASLIHPGRHAVWYGDDTQRVRAMAILVALLGNWGRRGGYVNTAKLDLPAYPTDFHPEVHPVRNDLPKNGGFPLADEVIASGICDAATPGYAAYDSKAWIIYGTNLMQALPSRPKTIDALQRLDFVVAIDVLPAEICGWADVVLPEATYLEREDELWNGSWKEPFIALRQRAVEPQGDSKPGWWMVKELAGRLGLAEAFPWRDAAEYQKTRVLAGGYDWEKLKQTGVVLGAPIATCEEEGAPISVSTETGKIELYCQHLKDFGFDPLPSYYPQEEGPAGMFRLLSGRAPAHTFGRTTNNLLLAEVDPENEVWINEDVARALPGFAGPLRTGDRVMLVNQDGAKSGPVKCKVTQRIRGDCVFLVHGWGQKAAKQHYANGRGASDSELTTRFKVDPVMGGTAMNVNFVRLEPVESHS